jgi:hypothetical protein
MMLAGDHRSQSSEEALDLVRRYAVEAIGERVIDPRHRVVDWEVIPMGGFVRDDRAALRDNTASDFDALWFMRIDEGESASASLAESDYDAPLTRLRWRKATIDPVLFPIGGSD